MVSNLNIAVSTLIIVWMVAKVPIFNYEMLFYLL